MLPSIRHLLDSEMVGPTGPVATETQAHSHSHSHSHTHTHTHSHPHSHTHSHPYHSPSPPSPYSRPSPPETLIRHPPHHFHPSYPGHHDDAPSKPSPYPPPYSQSSASGPEDYHVRPHSPVHLRTKTSPRTNVYYRDGPHEQDPSWGPRSQAPAPIPSSYRMQHTPPFDASISSSSSTSPSPSMSTATAASTPLTTDAIAAVTRSTAAASINDTRSRLGHTPQTPHKPVFRDSPDGMSRRYSDQIQSPTGLVHTSGRHSAQGWTRRPSNGLAHPPSEDPRAFDSEYHHGHEGHSYKRHHPDNQYSGHPQTKHQSLSPVSSHPSHLRSFSPPPLPRPHQGAYPDTHYVSPPSQLEQDRLDAHAHARAHAQAHAQAHAHAHALETKHKEPNPGRITSSPPSRVHPGSMPQPQPQPQPQTHPHPHYHPSLQQQRSPPLTDHVRESDHRPSNPTPKPSGNVQQTAPQAYLQHLTFQSYQPNRQRYATAHPTPSYGGSKTSESSQGGLSRTKVSSPGPSHPYHTPGHPSRSHLSCEEGDRPRDSRSLLPSSLEAKGHLMSPPVRSMAPPKPHDRRHVQRFEGYPEGSDYQDGGVGFRSEVDQGKASFHKKGVSHESFSDAHRQGPIRMSVSEPDLKESFEASSGRPHHIKHEEVEVDELEEDDMEGEVHGEEVYEEQYSQRHSQYSEQHLHELHQRQQLQRQQQLRPPQQQPHPHHLQAYEHPGDPRDPRDAYLSDPRMRDYARAMSNPSPSSFSHGYPYPPSQGGQYFRHPNQYPHHQAYDQGPDMMRDESREPNRYPPHGHPHQQPQDPKMPNRRGPYLSRNRALLAGLAASSASGRYKCQYCSKRFSRPSSLRIHTYSHTGERPFKCSEEGCGRQFSVQSNMRRHLRVHRLSRLRSGLPDEDEEEI